MPVEIMSSFPSLPKVFYLRVRIYLSINILKLPLYSMLWMFLYGRSFYYKGLNDIRNVLVLADIHVIISQH